MISDFIIIITYAIGIVMAGMTMAAGIHCDFTAEGLETVALRAIIALIFFAAAATARQTNL
jgi:hypothetical protein